MGVVKQAVNTSAGNSGFCGNVSLAPQAANRIHSFMGTSKGSVTDLPGSDLAASCIRFKRC